MEVSKILIILLFPILLMGQKYKQKADIIYDKFGFKTSIPLYEQAIYGKLDTINLENLERIATSCRLVHDTENAEKWYGELIKHNHSPINYLYYAQALQSNGNLEKAKKYYLLYDKEVGANDNRGWLLANAIDRIATFKNDNIVLKNEDGINSTKLDFSPTYYDKGIVFVSNRKVEAYYYTEDNRDLWLDGRYMALFYAKKQADGSLNKPTEFSINLTSQYHEGPLCFSKDGQQIFFTRNNYLQGKKTLSKSGVIRLNILTATKSGNEWTNIREVSFNTDEFDECHPTLSSDGKLYFSSNRAGGFGGMDLYVSTLTNGVWGNPVNLGNNINTKGNEVFPFIHDDGTLYYASNGLGGLGGLDIFYSEQINNNWQKPLNAGEPLNSAKDDFGFILNVTNTEGYLSSARNNGSGNDDIYSFSMNPTTLKRKYRTQFLANICVYDQKNQERLSGVRVQLFKKMIDGALESKSGNRLIRLTPRNNKGEYVLKSVPGSTTGLENKTYYTNQDGVIEVSLESDQAYIFVSHKDNYFSTQKSFTTEGLSQIETLTFCIPMEADDPDCVNIAGVVTNKIHGNRIPAAKVVLTNNCTGDQMEFSSNLLGEFSFYCLPRNCSYQLTATKNGFETASQILPKEDFNNLIATKNYELQLLSESNKTLADGSSVKQSPDKRYLEVGTSIVLEDIYYNFDDHRIRPDAEEVLDNLVGLMREFPSLEINLIAHTDSRGTGNYNQRLSDRRAKSAYLYLIKKGIKYSRLQYRGEGENVLRNHCTNGIVCSEAAHQYNRRTEVKVTKFYEEDVLLGLKSK